MQHGKPVENSEWVLSTLDARTWEVVESVGGGRGPNVGCLWKCVKGYKEQVLLHSYDSETGVNLSICVPDVDDEGN
jgi:hypothetical protein